MTTVKQLLEVAFESRHYFGIDIIEFGDDDIDSQFISLKGKIKFRYGDYDFNIIGTNADDKDQNDPYIDNVAEITASLLREVEQGMIYAFLRQHKKG